MMKSLILGAIGGLVFVGVASLWTSTDVRADNGPHQQNQSMTTDACAGCHRAHTAQGAYLLKVEQEQLCLTCHDGSAANTNVLDGVQLSVQGPRDGDPSDGNDAQTVNGALRGGGFQYARINTEDQTWRFSVQCAGGPTLPGYDYIPCTGTGRITICGSGTNVTDPVNNSGVADPTATYPNPTGGQCSIADYTDPGNWFLTIGVLTTPEATTSTHSVGQTGQTMWGNGNHNATVDYGVADVELECASCHNPHGNGQYRILRPEPASHTAVNTGVNTFSGGVSLPDQCPTGTTSCTPATHYDYSTPNYMNSTYVTYTTGTSVVTPIACTAGGDIPGFPPVADHGPACPSDGTYEPYLDGGNPNTLLSTAEGFSAWCSQCHSRYLARSQYATNSGDAVFTYRHSTEGSAGYNGRQCNTCHTAHGTNASMTGIAAGSTVGLTQGGSALLKMDNRGMCVKCHKVP